MTEKSDQQADGLILLGPIQGSTCQEFHFVAGEKRSYIVLLQPIAPESVIDVTLAFHLEGELADVDVKILVDCHQQQRLNMRTRQIHRARNSRSKILIKAVGRDHCSIHLLGEIFVSSDANGTEATYKNANLALSPGASFVTTPQLDIHSKDACCNHGATLTEPDRAQKFYLESRAIRNSQILLLEAFTNEILEPFRRH